jgi:hypothetical protein
MEKENGFDTVDTMSVKELRASLIKEGWSLDYFKKMDEISAEITKLETHENYLRQQKNELALRNQDVSSIEREIDTVYDHIKLLKNKLIEIEMDEKMRLAKEGKL